MQTYSVEVSSASVNKVKLDSRSCSPQILFRPPGVLPLCWPGEPPAPSLCPTLGGRGPVPLLMSPAESPKTRHWTGTAMEPVVRTSVWVGGARWGSLPAQSGGHRPSSGGPPADRTA